MDGRMDGWMDGGMDGRVATRGLQVQIISGEVWHHSRGIG